jgi:hypothetical protein
MAMNYRVIRFCHCHWRLIYRGAISRARLRRMHQLFRTERAFYTNSGELGMIRSIAVSSQRQGVLKIAGE